MSRCSVLLRIDRVLAASWPKEHGKRVDRATGQWIGLPGSDKRSIVQAMEMATRMRPFEVIELPLGRIAR